jgi:hypothetical protein
LSKNISDVLSEVIDAKPDPMDLEVAQKRIAKLRDLKQQQDLITAVAGEHSFREFIWQLIRRTVEAFQPPPVYIAPKPANTLKRATVLQQFSDWHGYEIVKAERTRGINAYNSTIMSRRLYRVVQEHIENRLMLERGGVAFDGLVISANGDFVSGTIHEAERHSDAPNIVMAVYGVGFLLAQAVRDLAAHYPYVKVFCTSGNHGRLPDARKVQQKDPTRSWDTLIYLFAQAFTRNIANVEWVIPDSYGVRFQIYQYGFVQTHGHDIKSSFSIPYYGINRMTGNLTSLEATRGTLIHNWLFSHFHSQSEIPAPGGEAFINGSLIGGTEFSINGMGKADPPQQKMMLVLPDKGIDARFPLMADVGDTGDSASMYEAWPWIKTEQKPNEETTQNIKDKRRSTTSQTQRRRRASQRAAKRRGKYRLFKG